MQVGAQQPGEDRVRTTGARGWASGARPGYALARLVVVRVPACMPTRGGRAPPSVSPTSAALGGRAAWSAGPHRPASRRGGRPSAGESPELGLPRPGFGRLLPGDDGPIDRALCCTDQSRGGPSGTPAVVLRQCRHNVGYPPDVWQPASSPGRRPSFELGPHRREAGSTARPVILTGRVRPEARIHARRRCDRQSRSAHPPTRQDLDVAPSPRPPAR